MIKNTQQKATNLIFHLTLTAGIGSIQSCAVYYNLFCRWFPNAAGLGKSRYVNAMQCNVMIYKEENNFVLLKLIFPFPVTRDQILFFFIIKHIQVHFVQRLIGIMNYHYLIYLGLVLSKT